MAPTRGVDSGSVNLNQSRPPGFRRTDQSIFQFRYEPETCTQAGTVAVSSALRDLPSDLLHSAVVGDDLEGGIDAALLQHGYPATIVCTAFEPVPAKLLGGNSGSVLSTE